MSMTSTTVSLDPASVAQLAAERQRAEQDAQRAAVDVAAAPTPATKPAPLEPLDPAAHAASLEALAEALGDAGGRQVPAKRVAIVAHLTYPAANKYREDIPYFIEILAVAGIAILVREAFFVKDAPPDPAKAPIADRKAA